MMSSRLSHHAYMNNILRDAKSMRNILKDYVWAENIIYEYLNLFHCISIFQKILKYTDAMTIYCSLFHLLNTVLNLLNIHIYMVNILGGSHNVVNNIEHVQPALA